LDVEGRDINGREVLRQLQSRPQTSRIPVIVMAEGRLPEELWGPAENFLVNDSRVLESIVESLRTLIGRSPN